MVDRQFRTARLWSNRELRVLAPFFNGAVVNVSAGDDVDKEGAHYQDYFANAEEYHLTNYMPGAFRGFRGRSNEHELDLRLEVPTELRRRYDVALSHTVFEHVFDVRTAFRNTCELSKDAVIAIVPFAQVQHESKGYQDFWRFTPTCLRYLFQENNMEVVYESCNDEFDAAVYILVVGSRFPQRWRNVLPQSVKIQEAGAWIGQGPSHSAPNMVGSWISRLKKRAKRLVRKAA